MLELIGKYLTVFAWSTVKFIMGPLTGLWTGISLIESIILTALGMTTTVLVLTLLGPEVRNKIVQKFMRSKKRFTSKNRKIIVLWRKYGLFGVTFLTPILFSPIGGTLIVIAFGEKRKRIINYMIFSACFWSIILNAVIHFGAEKLTAFINHYQVGM